MQTEDNTSLIMLNAKQQLSTLTSARSLYVKAKHLLKDHTANQCKNHLQALSVQSKFEDSAELEDSFKTWYGLLSSFHAPRPIISSHCVQHLILCPATAVKLQQ